MRKKRILIVDDEETMNFLLSETLGPLGYEIETAENGEAAIQQIAVKVYDLVITDYTISKMNGLELIRKIKRINPTLPVLVVNTNGAESEILKSGSLACLQKPLNTSRLQMMSQLILDDPPSDRKSR